MPFYMIFMKNAGESSNSTLSKQKSIDGYHVRYQIMV